MRCPPPVSAERSPLERCSPVLTTTVRGLAERLLQHALHLHAAAGVLQFAHQPLAVRLVRESDDEVGAPYLPVSRTAEQRGDLELALGHSAEGPEDGLPLRGEPLIDGRRGVERRRRGRRRTAVGGRRGAGAAGRGAGGAAWGCDGRGAAAAGAGAGAAGAGAGVSGARPSSTAASSSGSGDGWSNRKETRPKSLSARMIWSSGTLSATKVSCDCVSFERSSDDDAPLLTSSAARRSSTVMRWSGLRSTPSSATPLMTSSACAVLPVSRCFTSASALSSPLMPSSSRACSTLTREPNEVMSWSSRFVRRAGCRRTRAR